MAKVSASSWNGGRRLAPTVSSASADQSSTATAPSAVARALLPGRRVVRLRGCYFFSFTTVPRSATPATKVPAPHRYSALLSRFSFL